jgi:hypothetical protein
MPNWCNNTLELAHEDPAMLERARDALNRGEFLQEFIPVPQELKIVAGRVGDATDPKQIELEAAEKRNIETYGYKTWYDFCVNEWGTKWDVGGDGMTFCEIENGRITAAFDSAWSPPTAAYEKLVELGFSVRAYYYEGGMNFAGIWEDGIDDYYELETSSEAVREQIPTVLDEMFCISEYMAEWEAENEENLDIDLDGGVSAVNEQEQEDANPQKDI